MSELNEIIEQASPNFDNRPLGLKIDMLVVHYTGMLNGRLAIKRLCEPQAKVSCHYLIEEDGTIFRLVSEKHRAWHAGEASWDGDDNINDRSIGIELVNPGHEFGYRPFPERQMRELEKLCHDILDRRQIKPSRILGHSDVSPMRKEDPGELFDWERLAKAGIGIWPAMDPITDDFIPGSILDLQTGLNQLGYKLDKTGFIDANTRCVILAFQSHWLPKGMTGTLDKETMWRLKTVLNVIKSYPK